MAAQDTQAMIRAMIGDDFHAKRVLSLGAAVDGVMSAASLSVSAIGRALADEYELDTKHATKQVDRLLSNAKVNVQQLTARYARYIVGARKDIVVALDWTEFDADDHSTLVLALVSAHGRALPLMWKTVQKSDLKGKRNAIESELIEHLHKALDPEIVVTLLADRGFGAQTRYAHLELLGWYYVIRFKASVTVTNAAGESRPAGTWLGPRGKAVQLKDAMVTKKAYDGCGVVVVHAPKMKDPWCLAYHLPASTPASKVIALYGKRFKIEESFRDTKDARFGMGLSATRTKSPERRDRLLFIAALAQVLLTLLGAASEATGFDRRLKVNTSKKRTHSLLFQGTYWYGRIPRMMEHDLRVLMGKFDDLVREHQLFTDVFGII